MKWIAGALLLVVAVGVLLDRDGIERRRGLGPFDAADVLQAVDAL